MRRRCNDQPLDNEPSKKKSSNTVLSLATGLKQGQVVTDLRGKEWKLGKTVGVGGFGEIYLAADDLGREVKTDTPFVAKVERHSNGPLFVEINCYMRVAKLDKMEEWKKENKQLYLGIPHYVASGSHIYDDEKYRFLILPRFNRDLEKILQSKKIFNLKTVLTISTQIINVLEYIHSHGYVHCDIKASNIMLGNQWKPKIVQQTVKSGRLITRRRGRAKRLTRNLRPASTVNYVDDIPYLEEILNIVGEGKDDGKSIEKRAIDAGLDEVYLLDYGLASKYILSNGEHREFCRDERRAHAGTLLFCSRDAHNGVPSRRSDLESLAYNIVYWLTGSLPWVEDIEEPEVVEKKKNKCAQDYRMFLNYCFSADCPNFLIDFFTYLNKLQFQEKPDYDYCRYLFKKALIDFGYKNDLRLDFDNLEGWGSKQKKIRRGSGRENKNIKVKEILLTGSIRPPLQSNNILYKRPKLRKKVKTEHDSMMNWSKILVADPEVIIKQARERKNTESSSDSEGLGSPSVSSMDLTGMNPTYAMLEVYYKCKERADLPKNKGDHCGTNIEGYTPAMMSVYLRMKERKEAERQQTINERINCRKTRKCMTRSCKRVKKVESPIRMSTRNKSRQSTSLVKKETVRVVRKVKSVPLRRNYSLRG